MSYFSFRSCVILTFALVLQLPGCTSVSSGDSGVPTDDGGSSISDGSDGGGIDGGTHDTDTSDGGTNDGGAIADLDGGNTADAGDVAQFVYVGTNSTEILQYELMRDGGLSFVDATAAGSRSSFLAFSPSKTHLYSVTEASPGRVAAYSLQQKTGELTFINDVSSEGTSPAHLSVHPTGQWVLVANFGSGTIASIPVTSTGDLANAVDARFAGANAHQIVSDSSGAFSLVPCRNADAIFQYKFGSDGKFTANTPPSTATENGSGPRHIDFHPVEPWAYSINEFDSTLTHFEFNRMQGTLSPKQTLSSLPAGYGGTNTGAEVVVHPKGHVLYASNRGHDSIAIFDLNAVTGAMTLRTHTLTGGATPRSFTVTSDGTFLVAANQGSKTIAVFRIANDGTLSSVGAATSLNVAPLFVGILELSR